MAKRDEKTDNSIKKDKKQIEKRKISIRDLFYANGFGLRWKEGEVLLELFQTPEIHDDTFPGIRIYTNPKLAKLLKEQLTDFTKEYEKEYGKIEFEENEYEID